MVRTYRGFKIDFFLSGWRVWDSRGRLVQGWLRTLKSAKAFVSSLPPGFIV